MVVELPLRGGRQLGLQLGDRPRAPDEQLQDAEARGMTGRRQHGRQRAGRLLHQPAGRAGHLPAPPVAAEPGVPPYTSRPDSSASPPVSGARPSRAATRASSAATRSSIVSTDEQYPENRNSRVNGLPGTGSESPPTLPEPPGDDGRPRRHHDGHDSSGTGRRADQVLRQAPRPGGPGPGDPPRRDLRLPP